MNNNFFVSPIFMQMSQIWNGIINSYLSGNKISQPAAQHLMNSWNSIAPQVYQQLHGTYGPNMDQNIVQNALSNVINNMLFNNNNLPNNNMNFGNNQNHMGNNNQVRSLFRPSMGSGQNTGHSVGQNYSIGNNFKNNGNQVYNGMGVTDNFGNILEEKPADPFKQNMNSNQNAFTGQNQVVDIVSDALPNYINDDISEEDFDVMLNIVQLDDILIPPSANKLEFEEIKESFNLRNQEVVYIEPIVISSPIESIDISNPTTARKQKTTKAGLVMIDYDRRGEVIVDVMNKFITTNIHALNDMHHWIAYLNIMTFDLFDIYPFPEVDYKSSKLNIGNFFNGFSKVVPKTAAFEECMRQLYVYFRDIPHGASIVLEPIVVRILNFKLKRYLRLRDSINDELQIENIIDLKEIIESKDPYIASFNTHHNFRKNLWKALGETFWVLKENSSGGIKARDILGDIAFLPDFDKRLEGRYFKEDIFSLNEEEKAEFLDHVDENIHVLLKRNNIIVMDMIIDDLDKFFMRSKFFEIEKRKDSKTSLLETIVERKHRCIELKTIYMRGENTDIIIKEGYTLDETTFFFNDVVFDE